MRSTKGSRGSYTQTNSFYFLCKGRKHKRKQHVFTVLYSPYHFDQGQHCYSLAKQSDAKNKIIENCTHVSGTR